jgi:parallel beta-helix repeat protein
MLALSLFLSTILPSPVWGTNGTLTITTNTTLTEDHIGSIIVGADAIDLNCDGHTVKGPGFFASPRFGIGLRGRTRVTVKNCKVTNFSSGFEVWESSGNTLVENAASGNLHGFSLIHRAVENTLVNNTASGNDYGFILINDSDENTLVENAAIGNKYGFVVAGASQKNSLIRNTAKDNGIVGFDLQRSSSTLKQNAAYRNTTGFKLTNASGNSLVENRADNNSTYGFYIYSSSNNTLTKNTARSNGSADVVQFSSPANVFVENDFGATIHRAILVDGWPGEWTGINPVITDMTGGDPKVPEGFVRLYVTNDDSFVYFLVEFANQIRRDVEFNTLGAIYLDTDQDEKTGCPHFVGENVLGVEAVVLLQTHFGDSTGPGGTFLADYRDCNASAKDFPGVLTARVGDRYIEASLPIETLRMLTRDFTGFAFALEALSLKNGVVRYVLH